MILAIFILFFKNNFTRINRCKFIHHKSHLKPFLSYLPCRVPKEYFSIIFNVKKCTLYSIKCGKHSLTMAQGSVSLATNTPTFWTFQVKLLSFRSYYNQWKIICSKLMARRHCQAILTEGIRNTIELEHFPF